MWHNRVAAVGGKECLGLGGQVQESFQLIDLHFY